MPHGLDRLLLPRCDDTIARIQRAFTKPDDVAVANIGEDASSYSVEQRYPVRDKNLRPEVGIAAADARRSVHDRGDAAFDERLRRETIDIDVVDDGDIAGA